MQVYTAKALIQLTTYGRAHGHTYAHTQRIGPKGLYLDLQPRVQSAEDQGRWLPGRERTAGHPLLLGGLRSPKDGPAQPNPAEVRRGGVQTCDHAEEEEEDDGDDQAQPGRLLRLIARILCSFYILPVVLAQADIRCCTPSAWLNPSPTWHFSK